MKKTLNIALFVIAAMLLAGCYHGSLSAPGMNASGVGMFPPDVRYSQVTAGYQLANKQMDMQYSQPSQFANIELSMRKAYETCVDQRGMEVCRQIHGGFPMYMHGYYFPQNGLPGVYGGGMGFGMTGMNLGMGMGSFCTTMADCDLMAQSAHTQMTIEYTKAQFVQEAQQYNQLTALYAKLTPNLAQFSQAAPQYWSGKQTDAGYDQEKQAAAEELAKLKAEKEKNQVQINSIDQAAEWMDWAIQNSE